MVRITEKVLDGILEINLPKQPTASWEYKIICSQGNTQIQGKIAGHTQRTCLYIGSLKKGNYEFILNNSATGIPFIIA